MKHFMQLGVAATILLASRISSAQAQLVPKEDSLAGAKDEGVRGWNKYAFVEKAKKKAESSAAEKELAEGACRGCRGEAQDHRRRSDDLQSDVSGAGADAGSDSNPRSDS